MGYGSSIVDGGFGSGYGPLFPDPNATAAGASNYAASRHLDAAKAAAKANVQSAQAAAGASRYGSDQQLAAVRAQLGQSQGRYNQVFPYLQDAFKQTGGGAPAQAPAPSPVPRPPGNYGYSPASVQPPPSGGGTPPPLSQAAFQPSLTSPSSGPVVSPELLNQQINSSQAQNSATAAGQVRRQQQELAGRGLGAKSPLGAAIESQLMGANLGANSQAALGARTNAATLNANYAQAINQAQIQAAAARYAAAQGAQASMYGSNRGAQANEYGSQVGAQSQIASALAGAGASTYNAGLGYLGSTYGAGLDYQASLAQTAASRQNAILQALAGFANG